MEILFPNFYLYKLYFAIGCEIHMIYFSPVYIHDSLLADEELHKLDGVSSFQAVTYGRGVIFILSETVLIRFSVNVTAFITGETLPQVCCLTD
jgi:hypothetical protein